MPDKWWDGESAFWNAFVFLLPPSWCACLKVSQAEGSVETIVYAKHKAKLVSALIAFDIILQTAKVQTRNKLTWESGGGGTQPRRRQAYTNAGEGGGWDRACTSQQGYRLALNVWIKRLSSV